MVEVAAAVGTPHEDICLLITGISPKTLRKHFADELKRGMVKANVAVGGALYTLATSKGPGQATAAIYWTKTRMGWRETAQAIEHSGPDGKPIEVRKIERVIIRPGATDPATKGKDKRAKED
ncbi:hypothetical protein BjapCC829_21890 [Bradyrhizobium barranii]|uniref:Uncharacterized protein n=2 Tax=Bradyrhizobium TaxID=374 RepID=A0ABY3QZL9_9BRAD|nr:hypothetical protein [Bradyrhizobium japonicum]UFW91043.1 hypothetical protein BjapCC829_21890 [Bradyrhizobium japonicum]